MRKYALVILDKEDKILDRYNLDVITNPTGNGFKLNLSTISGDLEDIITKVAQEKSTIKFTVNQYLNGYSKANVLTNWIQKYCRAEYQMALEYDDGNVIKYCEGKVTSLTKTELNEYKNLAQDLEFTQTTPFFIKQENTITIQKSSVGKSYPFKYPYSYGASIVEDNKINNQYILDIPLIITINGAIDNPEISLIDESGNYNKVKFLSSLREGEQLIINSAQRKIYKVLSNGDTDDFTNNVDPEHDTFLRARAGISTILVNTADATETFKLIGGWRQYTL